VDLIGTVECKVGLIGSVSNSPLSRDIGGTVGKTAPLLA
jgi:hypothetical protein